MEMENAEAAEASIGFAATQDGRIKLTFIHKGNVKGGVEMAAEDIAHLITTLIAAAGKTAELSGQERKLGSGASLAGMPCVIPTGLGSSRGEPPEPMSLVVH